MSAPPPRLPRLPFVLLGAMTAFTLGGPLAIGAVLRGGARRTWPPDRAVEWATLVGVSAAVVGLMVACLSLSLVNRRATIAPRPRPLDDGPRSGDRP